MYDAVCEQGAGERRGQSVSVFGNIVLEEEREECVGV